MCLSLCYMQSNIIQQYNINQIKNNYRFTYYGTLYKRRVNIII